jgi:hypothetical protein
MSKARSLHSWDTGFRSHSIYSGAQLYKTGRPELINVAATSQQTRCRVLSTRKRVYKGLGMQGVPPSDRFDTAANSTSYLLLERSEVVGTIRISTRCLGDATYSTPSSRIFGQEITERFPTDSFVEASRLALLPSDHARSLRRYLAAFQNVARAADANNCDYIFAPTRVEHTRVYLGMGFITAGEPRAYLNTMCCLLVLDWRVHRNSLLSHFRWRHVFSDWNAHE